jgi:hypothetical protein
MPARNWRRAERNLSTMRGGRVTINGQCACPEGTIAWPRTTSNCVKGRFRLELRHRLQAPLLPPPRPRPEGTEISGPALSSALTGRASPLGEWLTRAHWLGVVLFLRLCTQALLRSGHEMDCHCWPCCRHLHDGGEPAPTQKGWTTAHRGPFA